MAEPLEAIARRLPRRLALELLESSRSLGAIALALELAVHEDTPTFQRWCVRLEHAGGSSDGRVAALIAPLFEGDAARAAMLARAEFARTGAARAALWLYRAEALRGNEVAAQAALDRVKDADPAIARRIAIERLRDPRHPIEASALSSADPRDRFLVARARLAQARGRYARVSALDALLELARLCKADEGSRRACLRLALLHADALGEDLSELEIDRIRTLHREVAPGLALGPPIDADQPPSAPTELELRAREALRGAVRGELPAETHADHAPALALTALAHLIGGREDAALPLLSRLSAVPVLPQAAWAVVREAVARSRARRAGSLLGERCASELPRPSFPIVPIALRSEPRACRALLVAALAHHESGAPEALRADVEREATKLHRAGLRSSAIAMLTELEAALAGDARARATLLDAPRIASGARIP